MKLFIIVFLIIAGIVLISYILNHISYQMIKKRILNEKNWDLNICCGKTDSGGINADIVDHAEIGNFVLVENIYKLPFKDRTFQTVLCSHTIEHVDNPDAFHKELQRVGHHITYLVPPLWDISAAFNILEHKWLFLTFRSRHTTLPKYIPLPFSGLVHRLFDQKIDA